jgi:hypothetical protein
MCPGAKRASSSGPCSINGRPDSPGGCGTESFVDAAVAIFGSRSGVTRHSTSAAEFDAVAPENSIRGH